MTTGPKQAGQGASGASKEIAGAPRFLPRDPSADLHSSPNEIIDIHIKCI